MLKVTGSMSTNTGVAPTSAMVLAEATNEKAEVMTSSPGPTPSARRARSSASVPELTPDAVPGPGRVGELALQRASFRSHDEPGGGEHALGGGPQLGREGGVLTLEIDLGERISGLMPGSHRRNAPVPKRVPVWPIPRRFTVKRSSSSLRCRSTYSRSTDQHCHCMSTPKRFSTLLPASTSYSVEARTWTRAPMRPATAAVTVLKGEAISLKREPTATVKSRYVANHVGIGGP